jgi:hypothetical protein
MTAVIAEITRADLARFALRMFPRVWSNWIMWFVVAIGIVAYVVFKHGVPVTTRQWTALAMASIVGASAALLVGLLLSLLAIWLGSDVHNGVLGKHDFLFTDRGLIERTIANETLIKWGGVTSVERGGGYIYVFVAPSLAHLIPRRSFSTDEQYEEFWRDAQKLVREDA